MKPTLLRIFIGVNFFILSFIAFGFSSQPPPIPNFPMVCRGGGNMRLIISPTDTGSRIEIRFRKGAHAYNLDRSTLEPGECAWIDRTINSTEPSLLWWNANDAKIWTEHRAVGSGSVNTGVISASHHREEQNARFFLNTVRTTNYFTVNVFNSGNGYFNIVSIQEGS